MSTTQKVVKQLRAYNDLSNFNRLKLLITKLSDKDKELVIKYLDAFDPTFGKTGTKTCSLFKYLLQSPEASEALASEHFGFKKLNSFQKLVERLKDKIGYVLTSELSTQRDGEYSKRYQAVFQCVDKLKRVEVYLGKKYMPEEAYNELNKIIALGKTYEIYPQLLEALYLKRWFLKVRQGSKGFDEITQEIFQYEKCKVAVNNAKQWHMEYVQYVDFEGYRSGFTALFGQALEELRADYTATKSATVGYFYHIICIEYFHELRQFKKAGDYSLKLLNLVRDNKSIYMPPRMGTAYILVADNLIFQRDFERVIEAVRMAQNYYTANTYNFSLTEEVEFWALFYLGHYEKADKKITSLLNNLHYKQSAFIDNKRTYLYACTLFAMGKVNQCVKVLEAIKEIHVDKKGWNVGIRILSLMATFCHRDREELSIHKLDAFRKHIESLRQLKETRKRDILIFKILQDLVKHDNDFAKVFKKRQDDFALLESEDPDYGWQIKSHELIIFPVWFKCMAERKPYMADISAEKTAAFAAV